MNEPGRSLPADQRPYDLTPIETADLPATPTRDRNIAASAWTQAPAQLLALGDEYGLGPERVAYKRRLGEWLLWRAGPARGPAIYMAIDCHDLARACTLTIDSDNNHRGMGPTGTPHTRFRAWKEDLLGR